MFFALLPTRLLLLVQSIELLAQRIVQEDHCHVRAGFFTGEINRGFRSP
jgi:hypothetical protein